MLIYRNTTDFFAILTLYPVIFELTSFCNLLATFLRKFYVDNHVTCEEELFYFFTVLTGSSLPYNTGQNQQAGRDWHPCFSNLGANVLVCHHHFTFNSNTFLGFSLLACLFRSHNRIRPFFSPIHAFHLLSIHSLHWLDSNTRSGRRGKHSYLAPSLRETVFSISFFFFLIHYCYRYLCYM